MDLATAMEAIDEAVRSHPSTPINVLFMGGEPSLAMDLIAQIVERCRTEYAEVAFRFKLVSNGTLIRAKEQEWLNANKDIVEVTLSIDGDRETHNLHRCNSYDKIDFDYWEHRYPNRPTMNMVITPETIGRLAENVIAYEKRRFYVKTILADGVEWDLERDLPILERELNTLIEHYIAEPDRYPTTLLTIPIYAMGGGYDLSPCVPGTTSHCVMPDGEHVPCYRCTPFFGDSEGIVLQTLRTKPKEDIIAREECRTCCARKICNACPAQVAGLCYHEGAAKQYCALEKTLLRANAYAMTQYLLRQPDAAYLAPLSEQQKKDIITHSIYILTHLQV